jgi:RNA polymerase sigma-70 factor, ECF subfamily
MVGSVTETEAIYRRYAPALLRKSRRLLCNHAEAEDVVQGLFLDLMTQNNASLDLAYLYRAVTNRCLNKLRDEGNRQRLLLNQDDTLRGPVRTKCDDQIINLDLLVKLLDRLDRRAAEVLVCRFYDDLTLEETALLLSVSRKTVGKRVQRIRQEIQTLLQSANGVGS